MSFVVRSADLVPRTVAEGVIGRWVIAPDGLPDGRLSVDLLTLDTSATLDLAAGPDELLWFQVLAGGLVRDDGTTVGPDHMSMLARGASATLTAAEPTELFVARVPPAAAYDPSIPAGAASFRDWTTEPVMASEHDARSRIYLASKGLWGTDAVAGELIVYPPDCAGAAHHHEGAEHFQYVLSGSGTAVLEGEEAPLAAGDLLYNLENEIHWFRTGDEEMRFVEFFVPGRNRTVWVPGVNACGWKPTGLDSRGREPARELAYHLHGQGDV
ncbi:MAG: cupin domain-containing protein [Candidatus Nanopelagicales bacterium]